MGPEIVHGAAYVDTRHQCAWSDVELKDILPSGWPEDFVLIWAPGDALPVREIPAPFGRDQ